MKEEFDRITEVEKYLVEHAEKVALEHAMEAWIGLYSDGPMNRDECARVVLDAVHVGIQIALRMTPKFELGQLERYEAYTVKDLKPIDPVLLIQEKKIEGAKKK